MPTRDSLSKIILILNELIMIIIHNSATLVDFLRRLHILRCTVMFSFISELSNILNQNALIVHMLQRFPRFRKLFTHDYWPKRPMRNVYIEAISTPDNFIRLTGLSPVTFDEIYVLFQASAIRRMAHKQRRYFSLINKNLLFLLVYWLRCYPTYPSLALLFCTSPQRISYLIRQFLPDLADALVSFIYDKWSRENQKFYDI